MAGPVVITQQSIDQMAKEVARRLPDFRNAEKRAKRTLAKYQERSEELIVEGAVALINQGKE